MASGPLFLSHTPSQRAKKVILLFGSCVCVCVPTSGSSSCKPCILQDVVSFSWICSNSWWQQAYLSKDAFFGSRACYRNFFERLTPPTHQQATMVVLDTGCGIMGQLVLQQHSEVPMSALFVVRIALTFMLSCCCYVVGICRIYIIYLHVVYKLHSQHWYG